MHDVVIVDAVRTPIGSYKGALRTVRPDDLAACVIKALVERNPSLPLDDIEDVIMGNANGAGEENRNVARMAVLLAGLPNSVGGVTVNRLCGSGLDAVNYAARAIQVGDGDIYIAGGTESMTRAPFVMAKSTSDFPRGNQELIDTTIGWRFINQKLAEKYGTDSMPQTAENVAKRYNVSREDQDLFAYTSQKRAKEAVTVNRFAEELVPVVYQDRKLGIIKVTKDEHPRPETTLEKLASLKPLFEKGTITAGNASGINDGASAVLLMNAKKAEEVGLKPLARFVASAVSGLEPSIMGVGPIKATQKALKKVGWTTSDLDLIELNEAFASQSLACIRELELDPWRVNVNGGAIAFGHPLGASGARILTTLVHEMQKRGSKRGLVTMCIGVGQGMATLIERA